MGQKLTRGPTMNDVAKLAGVSQTTVSFVLNEAKEANIPEETRQRIWDAVEELGYRPNAMAQSLRTNRSQTIGFIADEVASSPHAGKIIEGAQEAAWANEKILFLVNTGGNPKLEKTAVEMMLSRRVEGIIYATMYHHVVCPPDIIREVPAVLLDCFCEDRSLPSVVPDEMQAGQTATETLLQKGHRRIGYIDSIKPIPAKFGRLAGYKKTLTAYGMPFDQDLVCPSATNAHGGYEAAPKLMQLPDPPTAIFCFNDRMAMGAYDALKELGLSIPTDVAVISIDNEPLISPFLRPGLTTLALPHYQMGQWAVNYLIEHGDSEEPTPVQHAIPLPLIERESI